ncbi:hypothetical protein WAF17_16455 [Bernardetia sp. ABR2-2B]|uniref:hypothetical protein n=1 Tax=Bernardetia sp. ABR2-2B TaxID=3127472 RepID=UPI0030CAC065
MVTILDKIEILNTKYGSKDKLVSLLDILQTNIAHSIRDEPKPIPPLKKKVEMEKIQLVLERDDENYLLTKSCYDKRQLFAQRVLNNDKEIKEITYSLLVSTKDVHTHNSEDDLKRFLTELVNEIARVSVSETGAVIPKDEEL